MTPPAIEDTGTDGNVIAERGSLSSPFIYMPGIGGPVITGLDRAMELFQLRPVPLHNAGDHLTQCQCVAASEILSVHRSEIDRA
jgi:hypothetical protein